MTQPVVTGLASTAVKGTRLRVVESIQLEPGGAVGNREFFVMDARGRMVNGKRLGSLQKLVASFSPPNLTLTFPDGRRMAGTVDVGEAVDARFYSRTVNGRVVRGPWSEALSSHVGEAVRLVQAAGSVDRGARGAVSLISRASVARLASEAGEDQVDSRRFRMLIEIDGVEAHGEDAWVGRRLRVGSAVVRFAGHVGRCLVTSRDPESGQIDLPTLDILGSYRRHADTTEPLPFGIYGSVLKPGAVRVGDPVATLPFDG